MFGKKLPISLSGMLLHDALGLHTVDYGPFIKSQLAYMQSTLGPYVVQIGHVTPWGCNLTPGVGAVVAHVDTPIQGALVLLCLLKESSLLTTYWSEST